MHVESFEPEIANFPSDVMATVLTANVCCLRNWIGLPVFRSHRIQVESFDPDIAYCPSGVIATELT